MSISESDVKIYIKGLGPIIDSTDNRSCLDIFENCDENNMIDDRFNRRLIREAPVKPMCFRW